MSWEKVKLGQFLKNREGRYKPNDKAIQGLKRIEKINFSGTIFLSDKPSNTDMILVKKGDLVISGINVEKGAMNIYKGDEDVVATIHYSSYEFDEDKIDIDFLTNFLKSLEFKKALKEQVPGGIKTEIKPKHILPLLVEIPTNVKEQKRVVKKLTENNSIIEKAAAELTHQLDLIKQLRQAFLREAMQGKLLTSVKSSAVEKQATGHELLAKIKAEKAQLIAEKKLKKEKELAPINADEIPFEIPEHWAWCRLGEICDKIIDCPHSTPKYLETETDFFGIDTNCIDDRNQIYRLRNLSEDQYNERTRRSTLIIDDIIFAREGSIGKAVILKENKKICLGQRVMMFRPSKVILPKFLLLLTTSPNYLQKLLEKHKGMGAKHVNVKDVVASLIPLPPLHEQEQIVAKLEDLMAFCDDLEQSIKESQGYNEQLLQQVLREALQG